MNCGTLELFLSNHRNLSLQLFTGNAVNKELYHNLGFVFYSEKAWNILDEIYCVVNVWVTFAPSKVLEKPFKTFFQLDQEQVFSS